MALSTRIPPLLQAYVELPRDDSILLLTSTLGASANWLLVRFLCSALSTTTRQDGGGEAHGVVLVSWMREYDFWRQEARKGAGLDVEQLRKDRRFAFVDGLGADSQTNVQTTPRAAAPSATPAQRGPPVLPARGPPGRTGPAGAPRPATSTPGHYTLGSLEMADITATVSRAISSLATSAAHPHTLVVLDNPDLLLALNPAVTPSDFAALVLQLHTLPNVSHVLTHIHADTPLLSLSTPPQPLQVAHHNLLVKCAHMSRRILGLRVLDTGVARDVSGVVRVTEQTRQRLGVGFDIEQTNGGHDSGRAKELLYQVKSDGSVSVFERGAGREG
ncbi:hypothetical protein G6011_05618 [Alternaria panax]|uniref:Elongator complex protein 6 n=1 Tax=Alternaria panax TaxID=48097 RepID=A0AAD4FCW4_9PLEO|nr:hypothetical protein G6011_05618 [Alternaria panax]